MAEVRLWAVAELGAATGSSPTKASCYVVVTAHMRGRIIGADVTLAVHVAAITEVGERIIAVSTTALGVVAANSRENLPNAAVLTSWVIWFSTAHPVLRTTNQLMLLQNF